MTIGILSKTAIMFCLAVSIAACSSKSKEELFAEGMAESKKGNPNGAAVCFKSALEKEPKYFEARHQLAKAYFAAGRLELSAKEYSRLLREDSSRTAARLELARVYVAGNKPEQALAETEEYVKQHGQTAETLEIVGVANAVSGKLDAAEMNLLKALKMEPSRSSARLALANLFQQAKAKGREPEVRRLINEVIASEPRNVKAYFMLAQLESGSGNTDGALAIYRKIAEIDSSNIAALYKTGLLYIVKGDSQQAEQAADAITRQFPKRGEGIRLKGLVYYHRKNFTEAMSALQKSISIQPSPEAYYYLGLCHFNLGELDLALTQFRKTGGKNLFSGPAKILAAMTLLRQQRFNEAAAEIKPFLADNPGNAIAHNVLGSSLIGMGFHDEGMAEFKKAIELDPRILEAHLNKGKLNLFRGKVKDAENDFISALQVSPELLNTRLVLANLYAREKNHQKAMALLEKGLSGGKEDAVIYNYMAAVMFANARRDEGLKYLLKSKKADPAYLAASFNIATYYSAANDFDKAFAEYAEILGKSPENVKALINIALLKEMKKDDKEAFSYYKKALKTKKPTAYLAMAYYYLRKGEPKKALTSLDAGIADVAKNIDAMEMKRQILVNESRFDEAIRVCDDMETVNPQLGIHKKIATYLSKKDISKAKEQADRYITLNPSSVTGYIDLAFIYESSGDFDRAISELRRGMDVDRKNVAILHKLGDLHARKKDYGTAISLYGEVLQKNPEYTPALFSHGRVLEEMGKKTEAKSKYREVLQKSENYVPALNNLAYLNVDGYGNVQEGLRLAFLASRLDPSSPEVMDTLGYALLRNRRFSESQQILEKARKLLPDNPTVTYHLALAYVENGENQKARPLLQKLQTMGPFPEAELAGKLLLKAGGR